MARERLRKAVFDLTLEKLILKEACLGNRRSASAKLPSPARRRRCIDHIRQTFQVSERFACRGLGQHRSTQRKVPQGRADEVALASQYGCHGYRRITAMLREAGWVVNTKRVERIWRRD